MQNIVFRPLRCVMNIMGKVTMNRVGFSVMIHSHNVFRGIPIGMQPHLHTASPLIMNISMKCFLQ